MNFFQNLKNLFINNDNSPVYIPKEEIKRKRKLSKQQRECCGGFGNCHNNLLYDTTEHDNQYHPNKHIKR